MWTTQTPTGALPARRGVLTRSARRARAPVRHRVGARVCASAGGGSSHGRDSPASPASLEPPKLAHCNLVASVASESRTRPLVRRWDSSFAGGVGLLVVGGALLVLRAQRRQEAAGAAAGRRRVQPSGGGGAALTWDDGSSAVDDEDDEDFV